LKKSGKGATATLPRGVEGAALDVLDVVSRSTGLLAAAGTTVAAGLSPDSRGELAAPRYIRTLQSIHRIHRPLMAASDP
jgi:hypothetical protein